MLLTHSSMYSYRDESCVPRILEQQKACDLLNSAYEVMLMIIYLCLILKSSMMLLDVVVSDTFDIASMAVITGCYAVFSVLRSKMEIKHGLRNFYNHMLAYRERQEVVTKDNDDEVTFILAYRKTISHIRNINICYIVYLLSIIFVL